MPLAQPICNIFCIKKLLSVFHKLYFYYATFCELVQEYGRFFIEIVVFTEGLWPFVKIPFVGYYKMIDKID